LLYNFYAVANASGLLSLKKDGVTQSGWRIATSTDWVNMIANIGGGSIAGGLLKSKGTSLWNTPNLGATDAYGLKVLPGGYRNETGIVALINQRIYIWCGNQYSAANGNYINIYCDSTLAANSNVYKERGMYIRAVRDLT
jgi:uncharacterized protein (TIGR02145 family)